MYNGTFVVEEFNADELFEYLQSVAHKTLKTDAGRRKRKLKRQIAWVGADVSEAMLIAFERTGETRFLDLFVRYFDGVLALRDSKLGLVDIVRKRAVAAWGDHSKVDRTWFACATRTGRTTFPATEFARIVLSRPDLAQYRQVARRYLKCAAEAVDEFEEAYKPVPGSQTDFWYWTREGAPEPTNHVHCVGNTMIDLYALTKEERYRRRIEAVLSVFLKGVNYADDGTVHWRFFPYFSELPEPTGSELIWKAAITIPFVVRAHRFGHDVPAKLIEAMESTVARYLETEDLRVQVIPGSAPVDPGRNRHQRVSRILDFLYLAEDRPEIAPRLFNVVTRRPDLFEDGWFGSSKSAKAYAAFLPRTSAGDPAPASVGDRGGRRAAAELHG